MGIRNSIYSYNGNGINGLFSNRVKLDTVNKTIEESGNTSSLNAQKHYNLLQPVSLAVNKISQDASRILIELQDNDGVTIDDKDILNKYYYFLENKYGQNGISFSYQDLIVQIVSNLKFGIFEVLVWLKAVLAVSKIRISVIVIFFICIY